MTGDRETPMELLPDLRNWILIALSATSGGYAEPVEWMAKPDKLQNAKSAQPA